ncbi:MAG: UMP kinase [Deltaproteobacteria bacterium]|nr:UMP kinase [Deltaproteobacteria bacterium]
MSNEKEVKRVLLKLSGEMLGGEDRYGINTNATELVAGEIADLHNKGYEVGVVIGGGNIFRGSSAKDFGIERSAADYMGMLATCINGLALQAILENHYQINTRVMTAIHMPELAEPYIRRKAVKHLDSHRVVIFAGGTGNPYFTTDTAASLRALEVGCDIILKATKVDGIYSGDPEKDAGAKKFFSLSYLEVLSKQLKVMDATAITMCMDAKLPIKVFKLDRKGCVYKALTESSVGTLVK